LAKTREKPMDIEMETWEEEGEGKPVTAQSNMGAWSN
jgi:hypothetical protein